MRILVVGAGAMGGYFGAWLVEAGRDVTFLVRPRRAEQLGAGLFVRSPKGDIQIPSPKTVTGATLREPYDLVLLSCKAFDLDQAMDCVAPAMGPTSMVLPLLNGMAHIEKLQKRFGNTAVLGGQCQISATLDPSGHVMHLNDWHLLGFGELDGSRSARIEAVSAAFAGAKFAAADLIGIPWQILVGPKGLAEGKLEIKRRSDGSRENLSPAEVVARIAG